MMRWLLLAIGALAAWGQDLLSSGQKAFHAGDYLRAEALFRQHLQVHPDSAEAMSNLAAVLSRRGEFRKAVSLYESALNASPKLTPIHFNLGVAHLRAGDYPAAASSFRTFLASHPNESRARELLGLCLVETGSYREAIAELEQSTQPSAAFSLAYAHAKAGDISRSMELLASLNSDDARLIEAIIEVRRRRYPEARTLLQAVIQNKPKSGPALAALGRICLNQNEDDKAISYLEEALTASPHNAEVAYLLGVLYDRNQLTAKARPLFERSLQLRTDNPGPLYALARIELREKQPAKALQHLEQAIKFASEADAVHLQLGYAYQATGQPEKAKAAFAEVRRLQQQRLAGQQKVLETELVLDPP